MAFPTTPLAVAVELYVNGAWTDITGYTFIRDAITITRGQADEGARADPGRCALGINNVDGRFSPRNPTGPYYGQLGRNTPLRVSVMEGSTYLATPGTTAADTGASTPDHASLDITGDIDIRVDATLDNWSTSGTANSVELAGKFRQTGNQRSWLLMMRGGRPRLEWSADGSTVLAAAATADPPIPPGRRLAVRVTLDVNDGAGNNVVTFYTAPTGAGPWTQLGDPIAAAGTTSIFNSTAEVRAGDGCGDLAFYGASGMVHSFELRSGIGGSVVAGPDFTAQTPGAGSFADTAGRTWTVGTGTTITNRRVRFVGEVPAWPPRWDISGLDVWVPIEAAGILRRLGQGASPLESTLRRGLLRTSNVPIEYWPCEDSEGATSLASAVGGPPLAIKNGTPTFAGFDSFAASKPIPLVNDTEWTAYVRGYTPTGETQIRLLMHVPAGGATPGEAIVQAKTSGTASSWSLHYGTGGALKLLATDQSDTTVLDTGNVAFGVNGKNLRVSVELTQNGANVDYTVVTLEAGQTSGLTSGGTLAGYTVGAVYRLSVNYGGGLTDVAAGHLVLQTDVTSIFDLGGETSGWNQEAAAARIARLAGEETITAVIVGLAGDSAAMGPQQITTLLDLLEDAADADGGLLYETRDRVGLAYCPRVARYNAPIVLTLDYAAGHVSPPLEPTDDDQAVRNDITVQRDGGSSARAVQTSGPLSTAAPPAGVGRYDEQVTLNLARDNQLPDQASWRLHLGTWDEARYPTVTVDLARNPALIAAVAALESGDRIAIANPPSWLPPDAPDLVIQGYTEVLEPYGWTWTANCSPAGPYRVAVYGTSHYEPDGSALAEDLTTTETDVDVSTPTGQLWITSGDRLTANPDFELNTTGWSASGGAIARVATPAGAPFAGDWSLQLTPTGAASVSFAPSDEVAVSAGTTYRAHAWLRCAVGRTLDLNVNWFGSGHVYITTTSVSATVQADTWVEFDGLVTAPAGAATAAIMPSMASTPPASHVLHADVIFLGATGGGQARDFPFDVAVGGERMLVTAASGTSSPQTWTVIRSVNDVVKTHSTGAAVRLWTPAVIAL